MANMAKVEKTVFISYRRTNYFFALAIFKELTSRGYDVFLDYNNIDGGDFGQIILNNIESRAHFIILLTLSALEKIHEPEDWVRREIEYAMETKRNIVPVTMEDFNWDIAREKLTDNLSILGRYNALRIPIEYFDAAIDKLCKRHLNIALAAVVHPRTPVAEAASEKAQEKANAAPKVLDEQLTAEEYFEKGLAADNSEEKLKFYSKAIELKPDLAKTYNNRGIAKREIGNIKEAITDYDKAIELKPDLAEAYINRGSAKREMGDLKGAIADYDAAIKLKPNYTNAYNNRGSTKADMGDNEGAIADYDKVIALEPDDATAYNNRAWTKYLHQNYAEALADVSKSLELESNDAPALHTRGAIYLVLGNITLAISDFEKALEIEPNDLEFLDDLAKARAKLE